LGILRNVDHRNLGQKNAITSYAGFRVRELNVKRNFPEEGSVVLKHVHESSAYDLAIHNLMFAETHNKRVHPKSYILTTIEAFPVSMKVIAMPKMITPTVGELYGGRSETAQVFKEYLKSCHGVGLKEVGVAVDEFLKNEPNFPGKDNLFIIDYHPIEKKFIFASAVDTF
jgi:hypothetical protein